jgi:hypothetical protein
MGADWIKVGYAKVGCAKASCARVGSIIGLRLMCFHGY